MYGFEAGRCKDVSLVVLGDRRFFVNSELPGRTNRAKETVMSTSSGLTARNQIVSAFAALSFAVVSSFAIAAPPAAPDKAWWDSATLRAPDYGDAVRTSYYVAMRDGVKLAVDVWLPKDVPSTTRLPVILEQTRYYRSALVKADASGACHPAGAAALKMFVAHGYAYVVVDVRGTGASFGTRTLEYSDAEVKDGSEIVDWIAHQPWSDGKIGSTGQSYVGTTAELLLRNHNPAVKAVAPGFSGYDFYNEIVSPGGIQNTAFDWQWPHANHALDNAVPPSNSPILGPCPVDEDRDGAMLKQAIAQHAKNFDLWDMLQHVTYRDDRYNGHSLDEASPYRFQKQIDAAHVPVYAIVGWYDSGYALAAIRRFQTSKAPDKRLLIGPWNHGAHFYYAPGIREATPAAFDIPGEKLRYFDYYLKGIDNGYSKEAPVHYFTTGIGQWRAARTWPPAGVASASWCFGAEHALASCAKGVAEGAHAADRYAADGVANGGEMTRWHSTMGPFPVFYADRANEDSHLLTYTSAPLAGDIEVTGDPIVTLYVSTKSGDADFFVYLEEVDAAGAVNYVTEGELRASRGRTAVLSYVNPGPAHSDLRKDVGRLAPDKPFRLDMTLLPLSHVFRQGMRIRIAIAPSDRGQFRDRSVEPVAWTIFRNPTRPSRVTLPIRSGE